MDFTRCVARWATDCLRSARRSVHTADHRRQGNAPDQRHGVRCAATLFARRQENCLCLRSVGGRERVDHVARQEGHHAADEGQHQYVRLAGMDAGRTVCRRVALGRTRWHSEAVAVSRRRRQRTATHHDAGGTVKSQDGRRRLWQRPTLFVVCRTHRRLAVQQRRRAVSAVRVGQGIGARVADDDTFRFRCATDVVAGRQVPCVCDAFRNENGTAYSRSANAAGRLARVSGTARRHGIARADGCLSGLFVHAGLEGRRRDLRW